MLAFSFMLPAIALATPAAADTLAALTPARAAVLGAVQGLTEFLPISSSAHLFAVPQLLGWRYEGVAFDVALHWGTLLALLVAFWRDWLDLLRGAVSAGPAGPRARGTLLRLAVASVPAAAAGLLLQDAAESTLRAIPLQAAMLAVFGLLLWWVDRAAPQRAAAVDDATAGIPGWSRCLVVGCAQALALVPGVSRSGVTMTAGRATAMDRVSAARFSFLLATPVTFGAGLLELRHLPHDLPVAALASGMIASAIVGLLAIRGLLRWLGRAGFGVFAVYRVALAAALFAWVALR
jgi:undecaprenyl-diphosphatase